MTSEIQEASATDGLRRTPSMKASIIFPPSSGRIGSRLKAAQTTLTQTNCAITNALTEPRSGGRTRTIPYASKPRSSPATGPAKERTNCRPGRGRERNWGKVTPPNASRRISGRPPNARPRMAWPSSCTSTLTKTTKIQAAILQPNPYPAPRRMALRKNQG